MKFEEFKKKYDYFDLEKFYASPISMTSRFYFCPVPFRMDTYSGCFHDCVYCFANNSNQKFIADDKFKEKNYYSFVKATKLSYIKKYLDVAFEGAKNTLKWKINRN